MALSLLKKILLYGAALFGALMLINNAINRKTDEELEIMLRKNILKAFENFKIKYSKNYKDEEENSFRFSVFALNYVDIYRHNKFLVFSRVGLNIFADLTNEEFKAMYTGHKHSKDEGKKKLKNALLAQPRFSTENLPKSIDWREYGAVTAVKSQNGCGGCWAFSTIASIESLRFLETGVLEDLSTQQVIDCCRIQESGCFGGDPAPAFECLKNFGGIMGQSDYPYTAKQQTCRFKEDTAAFKIAGFVDISSDQLQVKAALSRRPLSICLNSSDTSFRYYTHGVITECEDGPEEGPDHCLLLVGYGHDDKSNLDYWLIRNQWGTQWGDNGYVKIIRDDQDHDGPGKCFVVTEVRYPLSQDSQNAAAQ